MRVLFALMLAVACGTGAFAQQPPATPAPVPAAAGVGFEDARQVREQFETLLMKYPPEVGRILKMDPTMLTNEVYLRQYPGIQQFLTAHPEIARNPSFYLEFVRLTSDFTRPVDPRSRAIDMWSRTIESVSVFAVVVFVASMIAWLVKTFLNHRRWLRMARVQTDAHNKLLDRFAGTNELLTYVQTPAGRRFLEAAPIPVDAPVERPLAGSMSRVIWSVQAGIILVVGGFGFQYVSGGMLPEVADGMWTIGVLSVALGLGFILAGAFSYVMARRFGLLEPPALPSRGQGDSPAL